MVQCTMVHPNIIYPHTMCILCWCIHTVLDVPPSEWQEIKALETYEWIQRQV